MRYFTLNDDLARVDRWEEKFSLLPRRCAISGKLIWLTTAQYGEWLITGPGEPILVKFWIDLQEFVVYKLKGKV